MRIGSLFLLLFLSSLICISQTIIPGGYVSGSWDAAGSPYIVEASITIHEDSALAIEEGTIVQFYDSAAMFIDGYVSAVGKPDDSITFSSAQNTWLGMRFGHNDTLYNTNLLFYYCLFSDANGASEFLDGGAMSATNRDDVTIFHSTFKNNYAENRGGAIYLRNSGFQMKLLRFINNSTGDGLGSSKGGAIYIHDSQLILEDLEFEANESVVAGAFFSDNSDLEIRKCSFTSNSSIAGGGALVCHNSGLIGIRDCIFAFNSAGGSGGAVAILEMVTARFNNCIFEKNTAASDIYLADGGGVFVTPYDNVVSMTNCVISNNTCEDYGGGVYTGSATDFVSCLFNSNISSLDATGTSGGGAIFMALAPNNVINCTFAGNEAKEGTSIFCEDAEFAILNSIIWDDTVSADASKIFLDQRDDPAFLIVSSSDIEGGKGVVRGSGGYELVWAADNLDIDPLFKTPGTDFELSDESPCLDTGRMDTLQFYIPMTDLAGNPRIFRDIIDLGCYENQTAFMIPESVQRIEMMIFPNPARDHFYLENSSGLHINGNLEILDLQGRILFVRPVLLSPNSSTQISTHDLPAGMYVVRAVGEDNVFTSKLLIQD